MEIFVGIKVDMRRKGLLKYDHPCAELIRIAQYFLIIATMVTSSITEIIFVVYDAKTFSEKADGLACFVPPFFSCVMYLILLWQRNQILELMKKIQSIINDRKWNCE